MLRQPYGRDLSRSAIAIKTLYLHMLGKVDVIYCDAC